MANETAPDRNGWSQHRDEQIREFAKMSYEERWTTFEQLYYFAVEALAAAEARQTRK